MNHMEEALILRHQVTRYQTENMNLARENAHLREALEFYADMNNYHDQIPDKGWYPIDKDEGAKAREALNAT